MKSLKILVASTLLAGSLLAGVAAPAQASTAPATQQELVKETFYRVAADQIGISARSHTYEVAADGSATATRNSDGAIEVLPTSAFDPQGHSLQIKYMKTGANELLVDLIDPSLPSGDLLHRTNDTKCALGTIGGAGIGLVSGGLAGLAVGTVVPGVGNITLGILGAVGGGVFGGMAGAASSCFD